MGQGAALCLAALPAEPASVPKARRLVREALTAHDQDLVDAAEICVSELVTNAVLHARTIVEIHVDDRGTMIRLEVLDTCPTVPRRLVHTVRSATGRGMEMVSFLATRWGVDRVEGGAKSVWCEIDVASRGSSTVVADDVLAAWSQDADPFVPSWPEADDPVVASEAFHSSEPEPRVSEPGRREVILLRYPVLLGIRGREHNSAIVRECALLSHDAARTSAPARLVALAQMLTTSYAGELAAADQQRVDAYFAGRSTVDIRYPFIIEARQALEAFRDVMAEIDTFAAGNAMLSLATPRDILELRAWTVDEFLRQTDGLAPRPWTGPLD